MNYNGYNLVTYLLSQKMCTSEANTCFVICWCIVSSLCFAIFIQMSDIQAK